MPGVPRFRYKPWVTHKNPTNMHWKFTYNSNADMQIYHIIIIMYGCFQYWTVYVRLSIYSALMINIYGYTIHLYCYAGATPATPYNSIATRVLHQLHHTSLLPRGCYTSYTISLLLRGCYTSYTLQLYCYAGATPYNSEWIYDSQVSVYDRVGRF